MDVNTYLNNSGTQQQNDVIQRMNRILYDVISSMMTQAGLLIKILGNIILDATYSLNPVPSKSLSPNQYEFLPSLKSNLKNLRLWGCSGFGHTLYKHGNLVLELRNVSKSVS